jgi:hypothetical protein
MARDYWFQFGSGNPTLTAGLAPTFVYFVNGSGQTIAAPGVSQIFSGLGLYRTNYAATQTIAFVLDGATTGLGSNRYISGVFDPQDMFGASLTSIGTSLSAVGTSLSAQGATISGIGNTVAAIGISLTAGLSLIGSPSSSFGSTSIDPTTVFGFLMRSQEIAEGNRSFAKATGVMEYYSRGSSTLLRQKTVSDSTSGTTLI